MKKQISFTKLQRGFAQTIQRICLKSECAIKNAKITKKQVNNNSALLYNPLRDLGICHSSPLFV